jgi:hypothetical protein
VSAERPVRRHTAEWNLSDAAASIPPRESESEAPGALDPTTDPRRRRALRVDDVGKRAVSGATTAKIEGGVIPRRLKQKVESAPIDHRDAFVLSLIDGGTKVSAILDVAGMPEAEVLAILVRLKRLGIITLG